MNKIILYSVFFFYSCFVYLHLSGGSRDIIRNHEDIEYFRQLTSATGVVIARAAMWNPAIFKSLQVDEPLPKLEEIICRYLTLVNNVSFLYMVFCCVLLNSTEQAYFHVVLTWHIHISFMMFFLFGTIC